MPVVQEAACALQLPAAPPVVAAYALSPSIYPPVEQANLADWQVEMVTNRVVSNN